MIDANWKLAIEAQCEAYHVRALHARTVSKMLSSKENPYVHPLSTEFLGAHRMISVPRNPEFELSPEKLVQAFSFMNASQLVISDMGSQACPDMTFALYPDVNAKGSNLGGYEQLVLFPIVIFHMSLGGDRYS